MTCIICSWEFLAFVGLVILWRFARSFLKVSGITNRHVFITGCDTGFGRLLAESLDRKGVHVFAGCFSQRQADELREKSSSRLKTVQVDVTDTKSVRSAAEYVEKELNGKALWGLVNNAGIGGASLPFQWSTKEDCRKVLEVNLLGPYDVTLAFLPLIKHGQEGRIVNISSVYGRIGHLIGGYAMSKYGIEAFSDGLSGELRPYNITVHTLNPGWFKTNVARKGGGVTETIQQRFSELSDEMKQQYGGERFLEKTIAFYDAFYYHSLSTKLHLVVEAYEHALFARYPKNRYTVGNEAKYFYIPLSWLPYEYQAMIIDLMQRITGNERPLPTTQ